MKIITQLVLLVPMWMPAAVRAENEESTDVGSKASVPVEIVAKVDELSAAHADAVWQAIAPLDDCKDDGIGLVALVKRLQSFGFGKPAAGPVAGEERGRRSGVHQASGP